MQLNRDERRILVAVLDMHLEGMSDARDRMTEDTATLNDFETFTETLQQHDIDTKLVESIRRKALDDDDEGDCPDGGERTSGSV